MLLTTWLLSGACSWLLVVVGIAAFTAVMLPYRLMWICFTSTSYVQSSLDGSCQGVTVHLI